MPTYVMWVPIFASAKMTFKTDDELTDEEARERILEDGELEAGVCYQCGEGVELGDIDDAYLNEHADELTVGREG